MLPPLFQSLFFTFLQFNQILVWTIPNTPLWYDCSIRILYSFRGDLRKKNSIFKDIVQIGGGEVNPCQKLEKKWIFDKSWWGRGSQNILSKIEALYFVWFITLSIPLYPRGTLFCMIYYSVCTSDPKKVIWIIDNVNFKA